MRRVLICTLVFTACGGGDSEVIEPGSGDKPDDPVPVECTDAITVQIEKHDVGVIAGEVGALAEVRPAVTARLADGTAVPVRWESSDGFVFPAVMTDSGRSEAAWVLGTSAAQSITASADCAEPVSFSASVAQRVTRANSVHFWFQAGQFTDYSVEVEAVTDPATTYYAALGFAGGYAGLQPETSSIGERAVLFSVWDIDGEDAELIDDGASTLCKEFGNEGTGIQCWYPYAWQVGKSYRFEFEARLEDDDNPDYTDYTVYFTDLDGGTRTKLATLRYGAPVSNDYMYGFAEDYGAESAHCLATAQRTVIFRNSRAKLGDSAWIDVKTVNFTQYHPRSYCANVLGESTDDGGFMLSTGGDLVGDPEVASVTLP